MNKITNIEDFIIEKTNKLLSQNGYGIKMGDLISSITQSLYNNGHDIPENFIRIIESTLQKQINIGILDYNTKSLSGKTKQFVYVK